MSHRCITLALIILPLSLSSFAMNATNQPSATTHTYQLETIIVQAQRIQPLDNTQDQRELLSDSRISAAHAAQHISGTGSSCRSIDAPEVTIRGLGWERVPSQLDFLPLYVRLLPRPHGPAGHQVTALYELVTTDAPAAQDGVPLKYAQPAESTYTAGDEMLTLKLRYKEPEGTTSKLLSFPLKAAAPTEAMDASFRWAAAVAGFGQYLRQSEHLTHYSLVEIQELAESAVGEDPYGYRREFIQLIQQARTLEGQPSTGSQYPQWQYRN